MRDKPYAMIDKLYVPSDEGGDVDVVFAVITSDCHTYRFDTYTDAERFICEELFKDGDGE